MSVHIDQPVALDAAVHRIADDLLDVLIDGTMEPSLIHLARPGHDGVDIGVKALDGVHPSVLLRGFRAPADWWALGVVASGWAYDVTERHAPDRRRTRAHTVCIVSRSGETAARIHVPGLPESGEVPPAAGSQIDMLRRSLGLPTDAPPASPGVLWAQFWLGALLAADPQAICSFSDAARLHPIVGTLAGHPTVDDYLDEAVAIPVGPGTAPSMARLIRLHTMSRDWEELRALTADGEVHLADCSPEDAAWFDAGSFARDVLLGFPPLRVLEDAVAAVLPHGIGADVSMALRAAGIPEQPWPDAAP